MGYETKKIDTSICFQRETKRISIFFFKITFILNFKVSVLCTDWYAKSNSNKKRVDATSSSTLKREWDSNFS